MTSTHGGARHARRLLPWLLLLATLAGVLLPSGAAQAHAVLVGSQPSDGATVSTAPTRLVLRLSESVVASTTKVRLSDGSGRDVPVGVPTVVATQDAQPLLIVRPGDPGAPTTITVALPPLAADVYRVSWSTLSAADLHVTSGVVIFGVQRTATAAGPVTDDLFPPLLEVVLRWLVLLGAGTGAAALVVSTLPAARSRPGPAAGGRGDRAGTDRLAAGCVQRILRLGACAAGTAVVAGVVLVAAQAAADGIGLRQVLAGSYGRRWALGEVSAVALAVCCLAPARAGARAGAHPRPVPPRIVRVVAAGLLLAQSTGVALLGHAAVSVADRPLAFVADVAHVAAGQLWLGLLAVAVLVGLDRQARPAWRALLAGYRPVAATSVAVVAISGLLLAADRVASLDALLLSTYGRLLLAKLGLAAVLAWCSLRVVRAVHSPRPVDRTVLGRRIVPEAAALAGVVLLAVAVASSWPAAGPEWVPASTAVPILSGQPQDLVETLQVSPNRPGRNFVTVDVFQTRRPEPGPIDTVAAILTRPGSQALTLTLHRDRPGRWVAPTDVLDAPGRWQVDVVVARSGVGTTTAGYGWLVSDPQARLQRPLVSSASLTAPLTAASALLALLVVVAALVRRRRGMVRRSRELVPSEHAPRAPAPAAPVTLPQRRPPDQAPAGRGRGTPRDRSGHRS